MSLPVSGAFARFKASDYNASTNTWYDSTGNGNSIPSSNINNNGLSVVTSSPGFYGTNSTFTCVQGGTSSTIKFTNAILPNYTLFHVARFTGNVSNGVIFTSNTNTWYSGFWNNNISVAFHDGNLTNNINASSRSNQNWLLSSDTQYLYRGDSVNMTTYQNVGDTFLPNLTINLTSNFSTSPFQVADVIIYNSYLTLSQIQSVENYLANLYGLSVPMKNTGITVGNNANLPVAGAYARFQPNNFNFTNTTWLDSTGLGHSCSQLNNSYLSKVNNTAGFFGSDISSVSIQGTANNTSFIFTGLLPQYTLFHIARYTGQNNGVIIGSNSTTNTWFSGFYNNYTSKAFHDTWVTDSNVSQTISPNLNWVLSTDSANLFRSNCVNQTVNSNTVCTFLPSLSINSAGIYNYQSSYQILDIIIYDSYLTTSQITTTESYLANLYGLKMPLRNIGVTVGTNTGLPVEKPYARFQPLNYNFLTNIWTDSTGMSNSIPSGQITNTDISLVSIPANFYGSNTSLKCIQGSTSTTINFLGYLPQYTLFHVARYRNNGSCRRIFSSNSDSNSNWLSGFWNNNTSVAYHDAYLTAYSANGNNINGSSSSVTNNWIISADSAYIYKANGINVTINPNAGDSFLPSLGINTNLQGETSGFQILDVIIYNTVLNSTQIASIESYLANLYGITVALKNNGVSVGTNAGLPIAGAYARFQPSNYDITNRQWIDSTGMGNSIDSGGINNTGLSVVASNIGTTGNVSCIQGTTSTVIQFTYQPLNAYTLFHVARFTQAGTGGQVIFTSNTNKWYSGFYNNNIGVAFHDADLTGSINISNGTTTNFLLSSDTAYLYRANGVNVTSFQNVGDTFLPNLTINSSNGNFGTCNFQIVDVIIYNSFLTASQIATTESYLANLYGLTKSLYNLGVTVGTNAGLPVEGAYARYKGSDYNTTTNIWTDSTGMGNNITQITSSGLSVVQNIAGYNGSVNSFYCLQGTTSSQILLSGLLPQYTIFHVARYTGGTNQTIFTSYQNSNYWVSGFYNNNTSVAFHDIELTNFSSTPSSNNNWLLSSDTAYLYRGNCINTTVNPNAGDSFLPGLCINWGSVLNNPSTFQVADVVIYDRYLSLTDIQTIEYYLANLYGLTAANTNIEQNQYISNIGTVIPNSRFITISGITGYFSGFMVLYSTTINGTYNILQTKDYSNTTTAYSPANFTSCSTLLSDTTYYYKIIPLSNIVPSNTYGTFTTLSTVKWSLTFSNITNIAFNTTTENIYSITYYNSPYNSYISKIINKYGDTIYTSGQTDISNLISKLYYVINNNKNVLYSFLDIFKWSAYDMSLNIISSITFPVYLNWQIIQDTYPIFNNKYIIIQYNYGIVCFDVNNYSLVWYYTMSTTYTSQTVSAYPSVFDYNGNVVSMRIINGLVKIYQINSTTSIQSETQMTSISLNNIVYNGNNYTAYFVSICNTLDNSGNIYYTVTFTNSSFTNEIYAYTILYKLTLVNNLITNSIIAVFNPTLYTTKTNLNSFYSASSPVIDNSRNVIYIIMMEGSVYCVNLLNNNILWVSNNSIRIGAAYNSTGKIGNDRTLYFGFAPGAFGGGVYAISPINGTLLWFINDGGQYLFLSNDKTTAYSSKGSDLIAINL